ncbi:MAG: DUF456 family protein [Kiritimatiellia bacterium]
MAVQVPMNIEQRTLKMAELADIAVAALGVVGVILVVVMCLAGIVLSVLGISGTWLVAAAAVTALVFHGGEGFPGLWTIVAFILVAGAVEGLEALSGALGVRKRGGSAAGALAALAGAVIGLLLGTALIPVPVLGSVAGMVICSFGLTFAVEWYRLKKSRPAAGIAFGTVVARFAVALMKLVVTLAMTAFLLGGMVLR